MSKTVKLLVGAATLWPILYVGLFAGLWLSLAFGAFSGRVLVPPGPEHFGVVFGLHCFTMVWIVALLAFYVSDVFRNERVRPDQKTLWAVVLFLGNVFAMPVYWTLYIWRDRPSEAPVVPPPA